MIRTYLILLLLFFTINSFAQDKVILVNGDAIEGKITFELPTPGLEAIIVKNDNGKYRLLAHEIQSIIKGENSYIPIKYGPKYRFMKIKYEGYLSLYYYRFEESHDFGTKYLYKKDGSGIEVPNFGFKKIMSEFLEDCKSVSDNLEGSVYKKNDLESIINDYNECIDRNTVKAKLQVAEVVNTSNPTLDLIDQIKAKVEDGTELMTLLLDIQTKVAQNKPIPGYLKAALKEQTNDMKPIQEDVSTLLKQLDE